MPSATVSTTDRGRARPAGPFEAVGVAFELFLGTALLGAAALAGWLLVRRPWPNRLDVRGYLIFPAEPASGTFHDIAQLGSIGGLAVGVALLFLVGLTKGWVRAVACASAPVAAVAVVQFVAKPIVGRPIGQVGLSYPSGTVTVVAALAAAAFLVSPRSLRLFVAIAGMLSVIAVSTAVVVLRWHYPTDALGGTCVGAGFVFLFDGVGQLLRLRRAGRPATRSGEPARSVSVRG